MQLMYKAEKQTAQKHQFAFAFASLPDEDAPKVDGNTPDGVLDGNSP